jgi:hypothetical protein
MKDLFFSALRNYASDARIGLFHALSAQPTAISSAGTDMRMFGYDMRFDNSNFLPAIKASGQEMGMGHILEAAASPLGLLTSAVLGYTDGGLGGMAGAISTEIAVNASMVKHGFTRLPADAAGVQALIPGRGALGLVNKFLHDKGTVAGFAGGVAGFADVFHRYSWGTFLGIGMNKALGGGMLGQVGSIVGGHLGVKYAGTLSAGLLAYQGVKAVSMGTYSVLKHGYEYRQARKQINTDGDMAAFMTMSANTMRERAVQAIQKSYINTRSALGQEAQYLSFPGRSYSSKYRGAY